MIEKLKKSLGGEQLLRMTSGVFLLRLIGMGAAYVFGVLLTRTYGAEVFGLYAIAMVVSNIASVLSRLGVDSASVKLLPSFLAKKEEIKIPAFYLRAFGLVLLTSIITGGLIFISANDINELFFSKPGLESHLRWLAISIVPFSLIQLNAEVLRGLGYPKLQTLLKNLFYPLFGIILLAASIFSSWISIPNISVLYLLSSLVVFAISFYFLFKNKKYLYPLKWGINSKLKYAEIFQLSFPMLLFGSTLLMSEWVNVLMLGAFGTAADVGVYRVVVRIAGLCVITLQAVNTVVTPRIASQYSKSDTIAMKTEIINATKLIFWAGLPIQVLIFFFGYWALLIFGMEFTRGLIPLYILLVAQLINSISGPVGQILNMTDGQSFLGRLSFAKLILTIFINLFLLNWLEPVLAMSISILLMTLFINSVCILKVKRDLGFYVLPTTSIK